VFNIVIPRAMHTFKFIRCFDTGLFHKAKGIDEGYVVIVGYITKGVVNGASYLEGTSVMGGCKNDLIGFVCIDKDRRTFV